MKKRKSGFFPQNSFLDVQKNLLMTTQPMGNNRESSFNVNVDTRQASGTVTAFDVDLNNISPRASPRIP